MPASFTRPTTMNMRLNPEKAERLKQFPPDSEHPASTQAS
jgi:hypothetical protein